MIEKIVESIQRFPERNAFFIKDQFYTYRQLGQKIIEIHQQLSNILRKDSSKNIAVMIYEDFESYASCVAVLLSGNGYVPLNSMNPADRNLEIIRQSNVEVLLSSTAGEDAKLFSEHELTIINTSLTIPVPSILNPSNALDSDPAYIIFTSGSTGKPKGAPISRGNLNSFLDSVWQTGWNINEEDKFLQMSSMTFDMSILTFIIPLCVGACIYTVPENEIKYLYGYRLMEEQGITFIAVVPSTLSYLKPYFSEITLPSIRYSLVCGEAFPMEMAEQWQECVPNAKIVNIYGPTEATVFTHSYHYRKGSSEKSYNGIMALGELVKNMDAIILDEKGKLVLSGEKGELCIAGKQLTSGYLNNPEKNAECFFTHPVDDHEERFYKTGDIVFRDADGCYYYSGRKDYQVKIQGHRVELGEIEKHVRDLTKSEFVAAFAQQNEFGNYQINLFIQHPSLTRDIVNEYLKEKIPYYMLPSDIILVRKMPLNENGKIDRFALTKMNLND